MSSKLVTTDKHDDKLTSAGWSGSGELAPSILR